MAAAAAAAAAAACVATGARAQEREAPFEPPARTAARPAPERGVSGFSPAADLLVPLVAFYQRDIGPNSIHRCPFVVSCSTFARREIEARGFIGLLYFVDRYFYRENDDVWRRYDLARTEDGTLRLDDSVDF